MPEPIRRAAIEAIGAGKNGYSPTQGIAALVEKLQARIDANTAKPIARVFVTSGTSGGLVLALMALVNPGDEVIVFDPYFVSYPPLVELAGGRAVIVDTYPTFHVDLDRVLARDHAANEGHHFRQPGESHRRHGHRGAKCAASPQLAAERGIALISDEIYERFCYDAPFVSPARYNPQTIVVDGFSKTYAMTGWRLGFAHGPAEIVQEMAKLQQYTFVCAPQPVQWAGIAALDVDMGPHIADYRRKRDRLLAGLADDYEIVHPGGAFYVFPRVPRGTASEFVERAIARELLIIPGKIFSRADTHFRISYAATDETIDRGIEILPRPCAIVIAARSIP